MGKQNIRHTFALFLAVLIGCSPSQRALSFYKEGNFCEFCKLSAESENSDHYSIHNLGVCFESGLCGYGPNRAVAIMQYKNAARWGIEQARTRLIELGLTPPAPDLKQAHDREAENAIGKVLGAVALVGLAVLAAAAASKNTGGGYYPPSNGTDDTDNQGCCSWHNGIARDYTNEPICHWSGMLLCNDSQPSPTCRCG